MTIEQLEEKFEDCFDANTHASEGGFGADTTSKYGLWLSLQPIIIEYAQQRTIEFERWNRIQQRKGNREIYGKTPQQLYDLFIEQQNSNK